MNGIWDLSETTLTSELAYDPAHYPHYPNRSERLDEQASESKLAESPQFSEGFARVGPARHHLLDDSESLEDVLPQIRPSIKRRQSDKRRQHRTPLGRRACSS